MIRYYPESALEQLEFNKIRDLLTEKCNSAYAREKASSLRIHTRIGIYTNRTSKNHGV